MLTASPSALVCAPLLKRWPTLRNGFPISASSSLTSGHKHGKGGALPPIAPFICVEGGMAAQYRDEVASGGEGPCRYSIRFCLQIDQARLEILDNLMQQRVRYLCWP